MPPLAPPGYKVYHYTTDGKMVDLKGSPLPCTFSCKTYYNMYKDWKFLPKLNTHVTYPLE